MLIGSSASIAAGTTPAKEKAAVDSLRGFIKNETGMDNDITRVKDWHELADQMANGKLQLGVFQGFEFAWAKEKFVDLQPLALAVNSQRYPVACLVVGKGSKAKAFADLKGQDLALPGIAAAFPRLFVERQCHIAEQKPDAFFAKITTPEAVEDTLDDVVDGTMACAAVERAALDAFKRRKPGRFAQLRIITQSDPVLPAIIAYQDASLDKATLRAFRDGLVSAGRKEKGQTLLTFFRLTGFEGIPDDFGRVMTDTRKAYPAPAK